MAKICLFLQVTSERDRLNEKLAYERKQNKLLSEKIDSSSLEIKKSVKEFEVLKSQLNELSQGKEVLSDELERVNKGYKTESESQKQKLNVLQNENEQLQAEMKVSVISCYL